MCNAVWISKEVFEWNIQPIFGSFVDYDSYIRSYEIWEHSHNLIMHPKSSFDLADGIANLKRSINQRLQLIENVYNLKSINFPNRPKGYLELLESYGIVRPLILKNLLIVRNNIEHYDALPPNEDRCKELVDVVWYFLKSTDQIVQIAKDDIEFDFINEKGEETHYGFMITLNRNDYGRCEIWGWFPTELINTHEIKDFVKINVTDIHGKEQWEQKGKHSEKKETDKWIRGEPVFEGNDLRLLIKEILLAY